MTSPARPADRFATVGPRWLRWPRRRVTPPNAPPAATTGAPTRDGPQVALAPPVAVRALFRRFWPQARRHRRALGVALVFVALAPAADAATIWVYKLAVDHVLVPRNMHALVWVGA